MSRSVLLYLEEDFCFSPVIVELSVLFLLLSESSPLPLSSESPLSWLRAIKDKSRKYRFSKESDNSSILLWIFFLYILWQKVVSLSFKKWCFQARYFFYFKIARKSSIWFLQHKVDCFSPTLNQLTDLSV